MNVSKTIAELYNGKLCPIRNLGRFNDEIKHLETLIEKTREDLESKLNDEQRTSLKKFEGNINEYMCLLSEEAFCDGFCMGTKVIAESLINAENIT